jgi:hypothetical protein
MNVPGQHGARRKAVDVTHHLLAGLSGKRRGEQLFLGGSLGYAGVAGIGRESAERKRGQQRENRDGSGEAYVFHASTLAAQRNEGHRISARVKLRESAEDSMNGVTYSYTSEGAKYGIGFGTALAIAISYDNNHSILWAIIHGFFSWLYVIYFAIAY